MVAQAAGELRPNGYLGKNGFKGFSTDFRRIRCQAGAVALSLAPPGRENETVRLWPQDPKERVQTILAELQCKSIGQAAEVCVDSNEAEYRRCLACEAIGLAKCRQLLAALFVSAVDPVATVAASAIVAIGELGTRRATRFLLTRLRDSRSELLRHHVVGTFFRLRDPRAAPLLIRIGSSPDESVSLRSRAVECLGYLKPVKRVALRALGQAVRDVHPEIRYSAVCGLQFTRSHAAIPHLEAVLSDRESVPGEPRIAERATVAIEEIRSRELSWL